MAETHDASPQDASEGQQKETVGELLKRERTARGVAAETIARDLKLSVKYITALEQNDYASLPADPYIRVYIRSIAAYLILDPEALLRRFFEDRGLKPSFYKDERATKLTITVKDSERRKTPWILIIATIAVLAAFSFIANKMGWISSSQQQAPVPAAMPPEEVQEEFAGDDTGAEVPGDSLAGPAEGPAEESTPPPAPAPAAAPSAPQVSIVKSDSLKLTVSVSRDSVWLQVFCDGVSWRNYVYPKDSRTFAAADSINVHSGNNDITKYLLNGSEVKIGQRGIVYFTLRHSGIELWDAAKWKKVFKKRLD